MNFTTEWTGAPRRAGPRGELILLGLCGALSIAFASLTNRVVPYPYSLAGTGVWLCTGMALASVAATLRTSISSQACWWLSASALPPSPC